MEIIRRLYRRILPGSDDMIRIAVGDCQSILDIGCGVNSPLPVLRPDARLVGVDAHEEAVEQASLRGVYDEVIHLDIARNGLSRVPKAECVAAIDLIEHLEKDAGLRLLDEMEERATRRVVVFTPVGFVAQGEEGGNPYQQHRSGWMPEDFTRKGYSVIGVNGWGALRKDHARIRYRPILLWMLLSDVTELFVKKRPKKAYHMLCVKEV